MRMQHGLFAAMLLSLMPSVLFGQSIETDDFKLKLLGRVQAQFSTTSVDEEELVRANRAPAAPIPASTFETRRVRFGAELEFEKWLSGKLEMEFGMARLSMRDAFLNMGFSKEFQLRVGQFKKPFSLLQLTSSSIWPVIERGVRIRGLGDALALADSVAGGTRVLSRLGSTILPGEEQELLEQQGFQAFDIGASAHGKLGSFGYHAGVFNGAGSDRPADSDALSWAGRVTYGLKTSLPVTLGAGVSHRELRTQSKPTIATRDATAFEADLEVGAFRRPGVRLLAEFTKGNSLADKGGDFTGAQAVVAYFKPLDHARYQGLEFAGRVSYGDPSDELEGDDGLLLTPGVNLYFFGRNRLMLNWDFYQVGGDRFSNQNALRAQAQFYF